MSLDVIQVLAREERPLRAAAHRHVVRRYQVEHECGELPGLVSLRTQKQLNEVHVDALDALDDVPVDDLGKVGGEESA